MSTKQCLQNRPSVEFNSESQFSCQEILTKMTKLEVQSGDSNHRFYDSVQKRFTYLVANLKLTEVLAKIVSAYGSVHIIYLYEICPE